MLQLSAGNINDMTMAASWIDTAGPFIRLLASASGPASKDVIQHLARPAAYGATGTSRLAEFQQNTTKPS